MTLPTHLPTTRQEPQLHALKVGSRSRAGIFSSWIEKTQGLQVPAAFVEAVVADAIACTLRYLQQRQTLAENQQARSGGLSTALVHQLVKAARQFCTDGTVRALPSAPLKTGASTRCVVCASGDDVWSTASDGFVEMGPLLWAPLSDRVPVHVCGNLAAAIDGS